MRKMASLDINNQMPRCEDSSSKGLAFDAVYSLKRILLGCPELPFDMVSGSSLPFECNLDVFNFKLTIRTKHQGVIRRRYIPVKLLSDPAHELSVPASLCDHDLCIYLNGEPSKCYNAFSSPIEFKGGRLVSLLGSIGLARMSLNEVENADPIWPILVNGEKRYVKPILQHVKRSNVYCK
ncbi:hypothetical protein DI09_7p410 [Mitosporidium daphniae]|uniref:Uncharacterized protein n=1 Tax=Mitosporidium daphniae TaxID=1485682 RepID=A0A098VME9_9MICR|nr:uncharacterized protein DI09_7p410 [Mitosporidium daphniae]KGG50262.1 hypothetical protein DI09_7p410 [Mitosporidium daphniae]|eukprot:XP_013236689.1 uncharacterized protein DI09_7p410 [Mitosporidium daphniae]